LRFEPRACGVDGQLDPFGAFFAVGQPTDGRGFADALDAVARSQADDDHGLLLHRRHGELMGANGRKVDQDGFDGSDSGVHTWKVEMDRLLQYCARNIRLSKTIGV
jgi:hypothetical protein